MLTGNNDKAPGHLSRELFYLSVSRQIHFPTGGAFGNWIDNKDPLSGAVINGAGSAFGYGIGKGLSWGTNAAANWWKGGWDPKFNPDLRQFTEIKGYLRK